MQEILASFMQALPGTSMWVEVLRGLTSLIFVAGLSVTFGLAIKWFTGPRARNAPAWHLRFAGIALGTLLLLLLFRTQVEGLLVIAVEPLNQLVAGTAPDWPRDALIGIFRSILTTLALVLSIAAVGRLYWSLENRLEKQAAGRDGIHAYWGAIGIMALRTFRVAAIFFVLLAGLPLYLSYFPRSRFLVIGLTDYIGRPGMEIAGAVIAYLPDFGRLVLILMLGRLGLRAIRHFFRSLESGAITLRGFPQEWALPTYRLSRTLVLVFILMVSYPYLPGSKSEFFHGFSLFVGALITFGSSGAISNIAAGTLLTYTRAFRLGDMVAIGSFTGVVIEKSLLVTKLRTQKNEEVSIPNGSVLSGSVLNYSARAATEGVVLTVSAGIGYDVDWRTVHRLMIEGAFATEHILKEPPPLVWQSELGDYAVKYELRALTDNAELMWHTDSMLRRNVLDSFNRAGVEIMTPSILAHRDASTLAVPFEQFPDRPVPKAISVDFLRRTG